MKAIAKKIKDNEWIAEVKPVGDNTWVDREGITRFYKSQQYPIVFPSDKEWLEKNNMEGKEVEGDIGSKTWPFFEGGVNNIFKLTTPPIHSDPAGEENKILKDALHALCISTVPLSLVPGTEVYDRVKIGTALLNRLGYYDESQPSTPQTGRTYTEGERNQFALDFAGYVLDHTSGLPAHNSVDPQKLVDYLKQNPKP